MNLYGQIVRFRLAPDIEGIVTAVMISGPDDASRAELVALHTLPSNEQYQVSWFHNGEAKSGWFRRCELKP